MIIDIHACIQKQARSYFIRLRDGNCECINNMFQMNFKTSMNLVGISDYGVLFVFFEKERDAMNIKKMLAILMVAVLLLSSLSVPAMAVDNSNPTVATGSATYTAGKLYFSNLTLSGDGIRTILISFSDNVATGDSIILPSPPTGFAVSDNSNPYNKRINVSVGTPTADIQNYLRLVGFTVASPTQMVSITVTTKEVTVDTFYNTATGHYYQYLPAGSAGITWTNAYTQAQSMTFMGRTGYLATVTSLDEDTFLNSLSGGKTGWLGGTIMQYSGTQVDANNKPIGGEQYYPSFTTEGSRVGWYWACGPEIGDIFYNLNSTSGASSVAAADGLNPDTYYNWTRGTGNEPNSTGLTGENCLTILNVPGTLGKLGTTFSWNDIRYNQVTQGSVYSASGYFVEYGNQTIGDDGDSTTSTPDTSKYATASGELSLAPVLTAGEVQCTSATEGTVKFTSDRPGTYYYAVVADGAAEPTIVTTGSGTACIAGENVITNPVGLTAGPKDIYIKAKSTEGHVSSALKMDLTVPSDVDLTDVDWLNSTSYTCGVELSTSARLITLSVNSGYFTVPSLGSGTLAFLGGTNAAIYYNSYDSGTQQFDSAVFSFTNITAAESLLSGIVYHTTASDSQKITASASTVSPLSGDAYFNGHFYRYVNGSISWPSAVLAAGDTDDPYFGGRGYLATATTQAENSILLKLTDTGGGGSDHWYDAWMGGLWQRNTGTIASPTIIRGINGSEITYGDINSATVGGLLSGLLVDYSIKFPGNNEFIYSNTDKVQYYWIDGPEAGQEIALNNPSGFSPWHSGEPNGGDFVYIGWEGAYWDDLRAYSGDNVAAQLSGYVLEFSGFSGGSTAGITKEDTKTVAIVDHATSPVSITPYSGTFDGSAHDAVTLSGALSGDVVTYSTNGTDFSSACPTGTNIGDYPVYVKVERNGYNPWISEKKTAVINAKVLTSEMVSTILSAEYTGQPLTPLPEITFGSSTLVKDTDYTVGYSHNTDIGLATVTITGKGNYSGTVTKDFAIFEKNTGVVSGAGQGLQVTADGLEELYNDKEIYTEEDSQIEKRGGQVSIDLFVLIKTDLTDDNSMIEKLALDKTIGLYLDISLFKTVTLFGESNEDITKINHTNDLLTIVIPIPDSIKGKAGIALYRVHNGVASMIPIGKENAIDGEYCTIDAQNITLYVRNFSTYAIGFDKALPLTADNGTNPDTRDYTNTIPFMVLGICSLVIAILFGKKRKTV